MLKKKFLFCLSLLALLTFSFTTSPVFASESQKATINYEEDGRVKPVKNADSLPEQELDKVVEAIGIEESIMESMTKDEKVALAEKGGKAIDLEIVGEQKTYYRSLDGSRIEYTDENQDIIKKKKLEDVKKYNELTGESLTLADIDPTAQPIIQPLGYLPGGGYNVKTNGKLELAQQVVYLGQTSTQYKYLYVSNAFWNGKPFNTKKDIMATAWDVDAVATANTFQGHWYQAQAAADGNGGIRWLYEEKTLEMKDPKAYGHYVTLTLGDGEYQNINMSREVRVAKDKVGHPAYVVTKYFHLYWDLGNISVNIGPASIDIPRTWLAVNGDETVVEYSYNYGDY